MNIPFKDKQIIKEGNKVFEKVEVDKDKLNDIIKEVEKEKTRRLKEVSDEFDVKINELKQYLK